MHKHAHTRAHKGNEMSGDTLGNLYKGLSHKHSLYSSLSSYCKPKSAKNNGFRIY